MPITIEQAWDATDPSQDDDARKLAAQRIMAGVAANDAYIASRPELEQYVLRARGGQVVTHEQVQSLGEGETVATAALPTASAPQTESGQPQSQLSASGESDTTPPDTAESTTVTDANVVSDDDEVISKLRQQLEEAGLTPEA